MAGRCGVLPDVFVLQFDIHKLTSLVRALSESGLRCSQPRFTLEQIEVNFPSHHRLTLRSNSVRRAAILSARALDGTQETGGSGEGGLYFFVGQFYGLDFFFNEHISKVSVGKNSTGIVTGAIPLVRYFGLARLDRDTAHVDSLGLLGERHSSFLYIKLTFHVHF